MAAHGGTVIAGASSSVTQLDTGNLAVTGSDLCLVCGASEEASGNPTMTITWDPAGNAEAMTGTFATVSAGAYLDATLQYLDNPTAATAPIRLALSSSTQCTVSGTFATDAGDVTGTDTANDSFATTGTSLSATAPNAASGDLIVAGAWMTDNLDMTVGANQTDQGFANAGGFLRGEVSTQAGADGGVMSYTFSSPNYGAALIAGRIPDVGGGASSILSQSHYNYHWTS